MVNYFGYYVGDVFLVGTTKQQILNTLGYYKEEKKVDIKLPSKKEISRLEEISIQVVFPLSPNDFIEAKIKENVVFHINADVLSHVEDVTNNYEKYKRGDLYKLDTGVPGTCFLPRCIMENLKNYNWDKHKKQAERVQKYKERVINKLEKQGLLHRVRS